MVASCVDSHMYAVEGSRPAPSRWLHIVACLFLLAGCSTIRRTVQITSDPNGATVLVGGVEKGKAPLAQELKWDKDMLPKPCHNIEVRYPEFESKKVELCREAAKDATNPWRIPTIELEPLVDIRNVQFMTDPVGASVSMDGGAPVAASAPVAVRFSRRNSATPWASVMAMVTLPDYAEQVIQLDYATITANPSVALRLTRVRQEHMVDVRCNQEQATVKVNGEVVGTTPLRHSFVFTRSRESDPWITFLVVVEKEGFRWSSIAGKAVSTDDPSFSETLTIEKASTGVLDSRLDRIVAVRTPVSALVPTPEGLTMITANLISLVGEAEREPKVGGATRITDFALERARFETRIATVPTTGQIVFSEPLWLSVGQRDSPPYFNIWMRRGNEQTRLTDAEQHDIEATVAPDGQWVYFCSDRLRPGVYTIWRIRTLGRGGLVKITDSPSSLIDTDPSVSPDGLRIAYTSYLRDVRQPHIWISNADGTLPTQIRIGKHPCWSPDGNEIAFVAADMAGCEKIWVMDADGSNPTKLTAGDSNDLYPVWTTDGKRIIYASDQAINDARERNFDIWIMKSDGTQNTQLTVNGSHDTRPVVSRDGKYVYFLSNRGARKQNEPALQIWRIELPKDDEPRASGN